MHKDNWPNHHNITVKSRIIPYRIGPMEIVIGVQGLSGIAEMEVGVFVSIPSFVVFYKNS
jgi:hypothetical protein